MAVITDRCIRLFELPDGTRPGSCVRYAGGWPTIRFDGLEAQEISRRTPLLRSAAAAAHVAEATFSPPQPYPLCSRFDFNHNHVLAPALLSPEEPGPVSRPGPPGSLPRKPVRILAKPLTPSTAACAADFSDTTFTSSRHRNPIPVQQPSRFGMKVCAYYWT